MIVEDNFQIISLISSSDYATTKKERFNLMKSHPVFLLNFIGAVIQSCSFGVVGPGMPCVMGRGKRESQNLVLFWSNLAAVLIYDP